MLPPREVKNSRQSAQSDLKASDWQRSGSECKMRLLKKLTPTIIPTVDYVPTGIPLWM